MERQEKNKMQIYEHNIEQKWKIENRKTKNKKS